MTTITKESLHTLIDLVDADEYAVLFQLLMKFVPSDTPSQDEIEALEVARGEYARGERFKESDIDWDNLDNMDLD